MKKEESIHTTSTEGQAVFKKCPLCGKEWSDAESFFSDPVLHLNGYQGNFRRLLSGKERAGFLLFTHWTTECGTTIAVEPAAVRSRFVHVSRETRSKRGEQCSQNTLQEKMA